MNRDKKTGILLGAVAVLLVIVVGLGIFLIGMKLGQKKRRVKGYCGGRGFACSGGDSGADQKAYSGAH